MAKNDSTWDSFTNVLAEVAHVALSTQIGANNSGLIIGLTKDWVLDNHAVRKTEADEVGLMFMAKSGFNPQAAP